MTLGLYIHIYIYIYIRIWILLDSSRNGRENGHQIEQENGEMELGLYIYICIFIRMFCRNI